MMMMMMIKNLYTGGRCHSKVVFKRVLSKLAKLKKRIESKKGLRTSRSKTTSLINSLVITINDVTRFKNPNRLAAPDI